MGEIEFLDEDGYPTEKALELIETWNYDDPRGWFVFIESLWYMSDYGWHKTLDTDGKIRYNISTIGWSGNESIIRAMEKNVILWDFHWFQSNRGGHYKFEVKNKD